MMLPQLFRLLPLATLLFICSLSLSAQQTELQDSTQKDFDALFKGKVRVSGYVQNQFNHREGPDSVALLTMSGGYFDRWSRNQFTIRRGRMEVGYDSKVADAYMVIDVSERGVFVRDFWTQITDPWFEAFSIRMGNMMLPFGHEVPYSSRFRLTPERSRVFQHLFPGERDLGAQFQFGFPVGHKLDFIKITAGVYNGNTSGIESDRFKNYLLNLKLKDTLANGKFTYEVGASYYDGAMAHIYDWGGEINERRFLLEMGEAEDGAPAMVIDVEKSQLAGKRGQKVARRYYGADAQFSYKSKLGRTTIGAEYVAGQQPSSGISLDYRNFYNLNSFSFAGPQLGVFWPFYDQPRAFNPILITRTQKPYHVFVREFNGGYVQFAQQIEKARLTFVFKYDWYDPNTKVKGEEIRLSPNPELLPYHLSPADIRYEAYNFGLVFDASKHLRLMANYELVKNEVTGFPPAGFDLIPDGVLPNAGFLEDVKDNVFTFRMQINF
jgi:hypothetical protein